MTARSRKEIRDLILRKVHGSYSTIKQPIRKLASGQIRIGCFYDTFGQLQALAADGLFLVIFLGHGVYLTFSCHFIAGQIFIVSGDLIDERAVWKDLHDTICGGLHDLMVV